MEFTTERTYSDLTDKVKSHLCVACRCVMFRQRHHRPDSEDYFVVYQRDPASRRPDGSFPYPYDWAVEYAIHRRCVVRDGGREWIESLKKHPEHVW